MICLCKPSKIRVYINTYPYKTMAQIKAETGCDIIFNGQMFNADATPTHNMRVDGKTLAYEDKYLGYGWDGDDTTLTLTRDYAAFDNFLACVPLIDKGQALSLKYGVDYPAALGGTRGRTAIGMLSDGRMAIYCSKDGTIAARSMEGIQQEMLSLGCVTALNLDGGGSCCCITPEGTITTSRTIFNYVCIWTEDTSKKEDSTMFKIALGAGHGSNTAGKRCLKSLDPNETREWWLNDRICDYVESYLKDYEGYDLLRLDDSDDGANDIALATRTNKANAWGADFYLSIHHNAGVNGGSGGGICAYSYTNGSQASHQWRDDLYLALIAKTGLKGNRSNPTLTGGFYVLRYTNMPAVLLELGFMDSKTDVPIILTNDYAQKCARAIVDVLVKRGGLTKKAVSTDSDTMYRVQLGAFSSKANAEALAKELKAKGYPVYIVRT